jgi:hypothetical protein
MRKAELPWWNCRIIINAPVCNRAQYEVPGKQLARLESATQAQNIIVTKVRMVNNESRMAELLRRAEFSLNHVLYLKWFSNQRKCLVHNRCDCK